MAAPRVGFVGLGAIGARMASRLVDAGHDVVVYNRTPARRSALVQRGATPASTPQEVATKADVVLGCLLGDEAVRQVYLDETGMAAIARSGQVFVEHATFSPALAREVAAALSASGAGFVDAPVSGGPEGAGAGTLTAMAGGCARHLAAAKDLIGAYVSNLVHAGPVGAGLELKLVNQLLVSCHASAAAEAEVLMQRMQIPLEIAADVLNASWASSAMLSRLLERRLAASAEPSHATIGGLRAPQQLIRDLLATHGLTAPVSTAALDAFAAACRRGKGGNDLTELGDPAPC